MCVVEECYGNQFTVHNTATATFVLLILSQDELAGHQPEFHRDLPLYGFIEQIFVFFSIRSPTYCSVTT